ncbi:GNAT family N-acetyltransferase [Sulfurirhabdus autotrophica]|uniref:Acetyltransferase (GNAT) family protein n=1 Tax=Sulfurirhabdus autotrophica TaxID=1706046 RepID=A0A4R3YHT5_9PROT|nr:GNAT family N-acetyltransferase [Sulfurirhabdus autotrophica]TCV90163.1 acetyltransferase (GNAT) family protein [Sulfurirhabdus autotrophica]
MNELIRFQANTASAAQIAEHLLCCDNDFVPPLSTHVNISAYSKKIATKAACLEAWSGNLLVGLLAVYCNDHDSGNAYITNLSLLSEWKSKGIATQLLDQCLEHVMHSGLRGINLEVETGNLPAIKLYEKKGFVMSKADTQFVNMNLCIKAGESMNNDRDYNAEMGEANGSKYVYSFDFDVMHPYMIKSFKQFFLTGSLLELGSFKGDFTKRLLSYFDDITCVEASDVAIEEARNKLGDKVQFVHSLFENAVLPKRYDNIVLTHVLEHLDDPVQLLKRINDKWLADNGRFFLVCPNANAPSRQIAVKMGLISHNSAVTASEKDHGHRYTYTLDTLERDAVAAGLNVVFRSGVFFKALANFQWDKLLNTDIISKEYLEGCYKLGQQYPDLCSSIFLLCEKGN